MLRARSKRKRRSIVGLDLGTTGIRAAQVIRAAATGPNGKPRYEVTAAASCDSVGGGSEERTDSDAARDIRRCISLDGFQGRRVCALMNPPALSVHSLELPRAVLSGAGDGRNASGAAQVVQWEMRRLAHGSAEGDRAAVEDVEMRHWMLPHTDVLAPNVIGVALSTRVVDRTMSMCRTAGLLCQQIDIGAAAAIRLASLLKDWQDNDAWGVLDCGASGTRLTLCVDGVPVLVRTIGPGGRDWTKRIAETLNISVQSAEIQKRTCGLMPPARRVARGVKGGSAGAERDAVAEIVFAALRDDLKSMAAEIKRSYEYLLSCYPGRRAADLVLVGGGADMGNLPAYLGDALGITVRRVSDYLVDPSCRVDVSNKQAAELSTMAPALGAAIHTECGTPVMAV